MHSVLKGAQCARRTRLVCTPQAVPCVQGVWNRLCQICLHQKKKFLTLFKTPAAGTRHATCFAKGRDRTQNLRIPSPALCQLHYKPDKSDCTTCLLIHWECRGPLGRTRRAVFGVPIFEKIGVCTCLATATEWARMGGAQCAQCTRSVHSVHSVLKGAQCARRTRLVCTPQAVP